MTRSSSGSCSTPSTPPSPDRGRGVVSRRGLLTFSAACVTALAVGNDAWAAGPTATDDPTPTPDPTPGPTPTPDPTPTPSTPPSHADYEDDTIVVSVDVRRVQDVTNLRCMITNRTSATETYRISYIDTKTNRESRPRTLSLEAGGTLLADLYGGLNRSFLIRICPASATECVELGPVALQSTVSSAMPMGIRINR